MAFNKDRGDAPMKRRGTIRRRKKVCVFCGKENNEIDYKDVALLRKFISDRGKIRSRRITGVTVQEQRELSKAIKNAREMALLPYATSGR